MAKFAYLHMFISYVFHLVLYMILYVYYNFPNVQIVNILFVKFITHILQT